MFVQTYRDYLNPAQQIQDHRPSIVDSISSLAIQIRLAITSDREETLSNSLPQTQTQESSHQDFLAVSTDGWVSHGISNKLGCRWTNAKSLRDWREDTYADINKQIEVNTMIHKLYPMVDEMSGPQCPIECRTIVKLDLCHVSQGGQCYASCKYQISHSR